MYTTKPLSIFKNSPAAAAQQPEGPNSGYLLLRDEEAEPNPTCCWGLCEDTRVRDLPFPQNRILTVTYTEQQGESSRTYRAPAIFIPVLDKPLSSNLYYVIVAKGRKKGKANTSSREEDMTACCFCRCVNDVDPSDFDPDDAYQIFEIIPKRGRFTAKSLAPDGFAPSLMRKKWTLHASRPKDFELAEAAGLDKALRASMPPLTAASARSVVGRWYTPCVFVKEEALGPREQMKQSAFYEVVLEQRWEEVYACENFDGDSRGIVEVKALVRAEAAEIDGKPAVRENDAPREGGGMVWFKATAAAGEVARVGLRPQVWERMRWEERRGGWEDGWEEKVVERVEKFAGGGGGGGVWRRFGCFVLVERFAVKRMNGSLALAVDFKHTSTIQTKWE